MTEQRAEQPGIPEQGSSSPLPTERGSERFSIKNLTVVAAGSVVTGMLLGMVRAAEFISGSPRQYDIALFTGVAITLFLLSSANMQTRK